MHIGLLTTSYPRFSGDHAGRFVHGFAEAMRRGGHDVDVLAPADSVVRSPYDAQAVGYLPRRWQRTFYGAGVANNIRDLRTWPGLVTFPIALTLAARAGRWDALVSHFGVPCALAASLVAQGRPHLAVWHSADVALASSSKPLRALVRRAATTHWCVTQSAKERLGLKEAIVSPMGAAPTQAERLPSRLGLGLGPSDVAVSFVGRLVPIKGLDTLIEAAAGLPLRLLIGGDGPERANLEAQARRVGTRATFFGAVDPRRRDELLAASDAFAMPSRSLGRRSEGAPCAILEAQLAGLPVLAGRSGGIVERVRHQVDGLLLPPRDILAWRNALRALLRGELQGMGAEGAAANAHLTWEALRPRIEGALRR